MAEMTDESGVLEVNGPTVHVCAAALAAHPDDHASAIRIPARAFGNNSFFTASPFPKVSKNFFRDSSEFARQPL
ncbi:MAG TPA: hypothetical protein VMR31_09735 [Myxococcota bacterium]|nr:hypothetical protein [Myxococcota bacterium]